MRGAYCLIYKATDVNSEQTELIGLECLIDRSVLLRMQERIATIRTVVESSAIVGVHGVGIVPSRTGTSDG